MSVIKELSAKLLVFDDIVDQVEGVHHNELVEIKS